MTRTLSERLFLLAWYSEDLPPTQPATGKKTTASRPNGLPLMQKAQTVVNATRLSPQRGLR
jgi:hypothetical protein